METEQSQSLEGAAPAQGEETEAAQGAPNGGVLEDVTVELKEEIGLPQLRPDDMAPQLIWLALIFGVLYLILSRVTLPRIAGVIEERRDKIADDLDRAAEFKREAERSLADYEAALIEARTRARAIGADSRQQVKAETDRRRADTGAELAGLMREAERRIQKTKEAALAHVEEVAADTAQAILEKLLDVGGR